VNNSFKTAIKSTEWNIVDFLRTIYNVSNNVPARRADYVSFTGSTKFPKKFVPYVGLKMLKWLIEH